MEKRKRAPGGGRRPGEFGKLEAVMSLRLPAKLRAKLQRAANQSGRTLSGELIWRLNASLGGPERPDFMYQLVRKLDGMSYEIGSVLVEAKRELGLKSKSSKALAMRQLAHWAKEQKKRRK
jgi:hypothetical protein